MLKGNYLIKDNWRKDFIKNIHEHGFQVLKDQNPENNDNNIYEIQKHQ